MDSERNDILLQWISTATVFSELSKNSIIIVFDAMSHERIFGKRMQIILDS